MSKEEFIEFVISNNYRYFETPNEIKIDRVIKYIQNKIQKSFEFDSGISPKNYKDRLFTETIVELQCIEEILKKRN